MTHVTTKGAARQYGRLSSDSLAPCYASANCCKVTFSGRIGSKMDIAVKKSRHAGTKEVINIAFLFTVSLAGTD